MRNAFTCSRVSIYLDAYKLETFSIALDIFGKYTLLKPESTINEHELALAFLYISQLYEEVSPDQIRDYGKVQRTVLPHNKIIYTKKLKLVVIHVLDVLHAHIPHDTISKYMSTRNDTRNDTRYIDVMCAIYEYGVNEMYPKKYLKWCVHHIINNNVDRDASSILEWIARNNNVVTGATMPNVYDNMITYHRSLDKCEKKEILGRGSYGLIQKYKMEDQTIKAIKIVDSILEEVDVVCQTILREITILSELKHPNIVKMYFAGRIGLKWYYGMPIYMTTIYKYYNGMPLGTSESVINHSKQLLMAVNYIHQKGIMHRDISYTNIMVSENGNLKLIDFGLARTGVSKDCVYSKEICSLWTRPIEILWGCKYYDYRSDLWSVGCILGLIIMGKVPFEGMINATMISDIYKFLGEPSMVIKEEFPRSIYIRPDLKKIHMIMKGMLRYDPCRRMTCEEALEKIE
jgi:hypothetical protein